MYTFCVYSSDKCILPNVSNFKLKKSPGPSLKPLFENLVGEIDK